QVLFFQQAAGLGVLVDLHQLLDHRLQQVDLQRLKVGADAGVLGIFFREGRQQRRQRNGDGLLVELAQLVARLALPLRQAGQLLVEALLKHTDLLMEALALGLRQLGKFGLVQRLSLAHRGEGDIAAVAVQGYALLQRQTLDNVQSLLVALVELAVDRALLQLVGRRPERPRKSRQQVVDQLVDVGTEGRAGTGRQLQRTGLARLIEEVDVYPVARRLQA